MLRLDGVSHTYPNGTDALDSIDLVVPDNCITAVIGGSGSGKSTLLRLVAGLERSSCGTVTVAGHVVDGPSSDVGVVFQEPRLMPWLTVVDNVTFGYRTVGDRERDAARAVLRRVGLGGFEESLPKELSGGMAQRVALARALMGSPDVLLLDEPFSALDALTRDDLQRHLLDIWEADRRTIVIVTHDIDEALLLADAIVVLAEQPGRVVAEVAIEHPRPRDLADLDLVATRKRLRSLLGRPAVG